MFYGQILLRKEHNTTERYCLPVKISSTLASFCRVLFERTLNTGRYIYPSLNAFKMEVRDIFPSRTVDRFVKSLVQMNILTKLSRTKCQSYQFNLNEPLLRLILKIFFPEQDFKDSSILNQDTTAPCENIKNESLYVKELLLELKKYLQFKKDYLPGLVDNIYEKITTFSYSSTISKNDLKELIQTSLFDFNHSVKIIKSLSFINNSFLGEY